MTDINRRLQYNSTHQKQAKQAAEFLELDRQGKEIEEKGQVTDLRGNLLCYYRLGTASLLLETPWERTEAIPSASCARLLRVARALLGSLARASRSLNIVLAQCFCVLPR